MDDLNKLEESILSIADGIPDTVVDTPSLQIDRLPGRLHSKGHLGAVKKTRLQSRRRSERSGGPGGAGSHLLRDHRVNFLVQEFLEVLRTVIGNVDPNLFHCADR
jgi:hypothetical protein